MTMQLISTEEDGREHYAPMVLTVSRTGNPTYGPAWGFAEIPGFYNAPKEQPNMMLTVGQQYVVSVTNKPNPPNKPYLDIKSAVPVDGSEQVVTEDRFDPETGARSTVPVAPAVAPASPGEAGYDDPAGPGPQPTEPAPVTFRDATRESIEQQVFVMELGRMLTTIIQNGQGVIELPELKMDETPSGGMSTQQLFDNGVVEWMRTSWLDGLYKLRTGHERPTPPQETEEAE